MIKIKGFKMIKRKNLIGLLSFVILVFMPIAWYLVMSNHSSIHYWMTNRLFAVSLLGYLFGTLWILEKKGKDAV